MMGTSAGCEHTGANRLKSWLGDKISPGQYHCEQKNPAITQKDYEDLKFGLAAGVDAIALSFVRTADDVENLRQMIHEAAPQRANTPIIAKLERPEALDNLDEIVAVADGVMVARGDLGVEMSRELPVAQKDY
jgi:pyruvate kinase